MKKIRRALAFLLTAAMLTTAVPAVAWAETTGELGKEVASETTETTDTSERNREDFVAYNSGGERGYVLVVWEDFAEEFRALLEDENPVYSDVQTFFEDGSYAVPLAEDTQFPCTIVFQYTPDEEDENDEGAAVVTFADAEDTHEVHGHLFRVTLDKNGAAAGDEFNSSIELLGYQKIETVTKQEVDLRKLFKEELKEVKLKTLLPDVTFEPNQKIAMNLDYSWIDGGDGKYRVVTVDEDGDAVIDLSPLWKSYYTTTKLEILDKADQFNTDTTRYIVPLQVKMSDHVWKFFSYDAQGKNAKNEQIYSSIGYAAIKRDDVAPWNAAVMPMSMRYADEITLEERDDLTVDVYEGAFDSLEEIEEAKAVRITDKIWSPSTPNYTVNWRWRTSSIWQQMSDYEDFTFVLKRKSTGKLAYIESFYVSVQFENPSFDFALYSADADGKAIPVSEPDMYGYSSNGKYHRYYNLKPTDYTNWQSGSSKLKLKWSGAQPGKDAEVKLYQGYYDTVDALKAANPAEVSDLWGADNVSGHTADYTNYANPPMFTVAVMKEDAVSWVYPFAVYVTPKIERTNAETVSLTAGSLYSKNEYGNVENVSSYANDSNGYHYWNIPEPYELDGTYFTYMSLYDSDIVSTDRGWSKIKKIVRGAYTSETAAAGQSDIKDLMFEKRENGSISSKSFELNFNTQPLVFTIFYHDGSNEQVRMRTFRADPDEENAYSGSTDTYFYLKDIKGYNVYTLPSHADSSYSDGFQTLFLLKDSSTGLSEKENITAQFKTGSGVRMYRDHDEAGKRINMQGESEDTISFENGKALRYSAASESGTHLRNYWITLLTQQPGAKLWVNGQNDMDHATNGVPTREVFIYYQGGYHDIAIANIGDAPLEDLSVKLEGNANGALRLDDYWTVGETKTLKAFTTTEPAGRDSQIDNVGKIRLWADGRGEVDASLVISAKGQTPVTIKLTGKVGQPSIMTKKVPAGVKFVPYSAILQTNYASGSGGENPMFFLKSGSLPRGITLNPNTGEIYGVPVEYGETFRFTVGIRQYNEEVDSRAYTMTIAENTDPNVWGASDTDYTIVTPIGTAGTEQYYYEIDLAAFTGSADAAKEFVSNGTYVFFEKVFIDGTELKEGTDYQVEEGSTKLALFESTLKKFNTNGRHTLAVEFRENRSSKTSSGQLKGVLKRTAQNYYIKGGTNQSNNNNSTSGGGGGGTTQTPTKPETPTEPETPTTPTVPAEGFVDIPQAAWFYQDVNWANENGLMLGVGANRFAPNQNMSQAMIYTVLARMSGADLSAFDHTGVDGIRSGQWYTKAALWALQNGLFESGKFDDQAVLSREEVAVILLKYLSVTGIKVNEDAQSVPFADEAQMSEAGARAFRILYHHEIYRGVGEDRMNPAGAMTRAQFAVLIHRIHTFSKQSQGETF